MRRTIGSRASSPRHGAAGYSLIEVLVTLFIMAVVMAGVATMLDAADRVTRSQSSVAELQTNHRVAQQEIARMLANAGVGGLPETVPDTLAGGSTAGVFPNGLGIAVQNNVAAGTRVGDNASPPVVEGTDVLTVRGVFTTPVLFIEPQIPLTLVNDRITLVVSRNVDVGVTQELDRLRAVLVTAVANDRPEAFIVRDRFNPGAFAVLELDRQATVPGNDGDPTLTVGLILADAGGVQDYANEYGRLILGTSLVAGAGGSTVTLPDNTTVTLPRSIGTIGLLEEYRFFVEEVWEVSGDPNSRPTPVLSRARFYPNTNDMHPTGSIELAEGIIDMQLALGVDLPPRDGQILDNGDAADEVIYNHPNDNDGLNPLSGTWAVPDAQLFFARLNLVAQAPEPERDFEGIVLGAIEDHDHAAAGNVSVFNTGSNTKVRKRLLRTVIDVRNLP